jgi:phytoene dehydrogenase-like protein
VPWKDPAAKHAATLHLGGSLEEIAFSERELWFGRISDKPLVLAAQHTLFDQTRAPEGKHTLWGYCHVPNGSTVDMTSRIEAQIERFAPGFRECILGRSVLSPQALEVHNPNLIGGDITGGDQDIWQLAVRPSLRYWATPLENVFICSSSTPPGAGVHGMCGYFAARLALKRRFGVTLGSGLSEI